VRDKLILIFKQRRRYPLLTEDMDSIRRAIQEPCSEIELQDKGLKTHSKELRQGSLTRPNIPVPVVRLPPELLSRVFISVDRHYQTTISEDGSFSLHHLRLICAVCHHWRAVAKGCSQLWERFNLAWTPEDQIWFLAQNPDSSLRATLPANATTIHLTVQLMGSLHRLVELTSVYDHARTISPRMRTLLHAIMLSHPCKLECLAIPIYPETPDCFIRGLVDVFPLSLRRLSLIYYTVLAPFPHLLALGIYKVARPAIVFLDYLLQMAQLCPSIKDICLSDVQLHQRATTANRVPAHFENLRHYSVRGGLKDSTYLLTVLSAPAGCCFAVSSQNEGLSYHTLESFFLAVRSMFSGNGSWNLPTIGCVSCSTPLVMLSIELLSNSITLRADKKQRHDLLPQNAWRGRDSHNSDRLPLIDISIRETRTAFGGFDLEDEIPDISYFYCALQYIQWENIQTLVCHISTNHFEFDGMKALSLSRLINLQNLTIIDLDIESAEQFAEDLLPEKILSLPMLQHLRWRYSNMGMARKLAQVGKAIFPGLIQKRRVRQAYLDMIAILCDHGGKRDPDYLGRWTIDLDGTVKLRWDCT
jgi:hypothetical protein